MAAWTPQQHPQTSPSPHPESPRHILATPALTLNTQCHLLSRATSLPILFHYFSISHFRISVLRNIRVPGGEKKPIKAKPGRNSSIFYQSSSLQAAAFSKRLLPGELQILRGCLPPPHPQHGVLCQSHCSFLPWVTTEPPPPANSTACFLRTDARLHPGRKASHFLPILQLAGRWSRWGFLTSRDDLLSQMILSREKLSCPLRMFSSISGCHSETAGTVSRCHQMSPKGQSHSG